MISSLAWVPRGAPRAGRQAAPEEGGAQGDMEAEEEALAAEMEALEEAEESDDYDGSDEDEEMDVEAAAVAAAAEAEAEAAEAKANAAAAAVGGNRRARRAALQPADRPRSERGARQNKSKRQAADEALLAGLDMDAYSDEEDLDLSERLAGSAADLGGMYYASSRDDPYLDKAPGGAGGSRDADADSDSDAEDLRESDLCIVATKQDEDVSSLVMYVYEDVSEDVARADGGNLIPHRDLVLPAYPLCLAWMDIDPLQRADEAYGNFVATGTFEPEIEIFNLDALGQVEPDRTLGGRLSKKQRAKKKAAGSLGKGVKKGSHSDAVMALSWNQHFRNVLASGSADQTVKLWDVVEGKCQSTLKHHSDKVQSVCWNPSEGAVLATGCFAGEACVLDVRADDAAKVALRWRLSSDCEAIAWDPLDSTRFAASSDDGRVSVFDARKGGGSKPLYKLPRSKKPQCCLAFNPAAKGLLAAGSTDKLVRLWDFADLPADGGKVEQPLALKDVRCGGVFSVGWSRDAPYLLAAGGSKGEATVWDLRCEEEDVKRRIPR